MSELIARRLSRPTGGQITRLYRAEATEETMIEAFLASLVASDSRRELIPFRHHREFLTRRRVQRFKA